MDGWRDNLVDSPEGIEAILRECRRIAVLGIKAEAQRDRPAFYAPEYMARAGYDIVPVPVYFPEATEIMGRPVYRKLADVPQPVDMVNVFRRSHDIPQHVPDILAAHPKVVWIQTGIRNDAIAEALARAGIKVVQDR
jgi:predicted CoA-binding protein